MRGLLCCALLAAILPCATPGFANDTAIDRLIAAALTRANSIPLLAESTIEYEVRRGRVQIAGRCGSAAAKRYVLNLVRFAPGVIAVDDQISVGPPVTHPTVAAPLAPRENLPQTGARGEISDHMNSLNHPVAKSYPQRPIRFPSYRERQIAEKQQSPTTNSGHIATATPQPPKSVATPAQLRSLPPVPADRAPAKEPSPPIDPLVQRASIDRREIEGAARFPLSKTEQAPQELRSNKCEIEANLSTMQPASGSKPDPAMNDHTSFQDMPQAIEPELLAAASPGQMRIVPSSAIGPTTDALPPTPFPHSPVEPATRFSSRIAWVVIFLAAGAALTVQLLRRRG